MKKNNPNTINSHIIQREAGMSDEQALEFFVKHIHLNYFSGPKNNFLAIEDKTYSSRNAISVELVTQMNKVEMIDLQFLNCGGKPINGFSLTKIAKFNSRVMIINNFDLVDHSSLNPLYKFVNNGGSLIVIDKKFDFSIFPPTCHPLIARFFNDHVSLPSQL